MRLNILAQCALFASIIGTSPLAFTADIAPSTNEGDAAGVITKTEDVSEVDFSIWRRQKAGINEANPEHDKLLSTFHSFGIDPVGETLTYIKGDEDQRKAKIEAAKAYCVDMEDNKRNLKNYVEGSFKCDLEDKFSYSVPTRYYLMGSELNVAELVLCIFRPCSSTPGYDAHEIKIHMSWKEFAGAQ
jgi:hypothetical protein